MIDIEGYEVDEEVNKGGSSVLYRGTDSSTDRTVAVKVLHDHLTDRSGTVKTFRYEAKLLKKLEEEEQILDLYDTGTVEGRPYMVLEYVEGENLRALMRSRPDLVRSYWKTIGIRTAQGLAALHMNDIIHKDVKPENILVSSDLEVWLIDLSIAMEKGFFSYLFGSGDVQGTPKYMSPEQINGEELGFASDVYSLGICLYEMATGEPPFQGHTEQQVLRANRHSRPRPPHKKNEEIDLNLSMFIMQMLEKDPDKRVPDMNLVIHNLKKYWTPPAKERIRSELTPLEEVRENGDGDTNLLPPESYVFCEQRDSRDEAYRKPDGERHSLLNVSRGGIGFLSEEKYRIGDLLDLFLVIPSTGDEIRLRGEVQWCVQKGEENTGTYSVAVNLVLREPNYLERFDRLKDAQDVDIDFKRDDRP